MLPAVTMAVVILFIVFHPAAAVSLPPGHGFFGIDLLCKHKDITKACQSTHKETDYADPARGKMLIQKQPEPSAQQYRHYHIYPELGYHGQRSEHIRAIVIFFHTTPLYLLLHIMSIKYS